MLGRGRVREQRLDLAAQCRISTAGNSQERGSLRRVTIERLLANPFDVALAVGGHDFVVPLSLRKKGEKRAL